MILKILIENMKEEVCWKTYGVDGRTTLMWNLKE
jgi:hypothetical protein